MCIVVKEFLIEQMDDVIQFELELRKQEPTWNWPTDDGRFQLLKKSFEDERFKHSLSLLAYDGDSVVGRLDIALIASHFEGTVKAYLDWICVLTSHRHRGIGQMLLEAARQRLKETGATNLVALIAQNDEAQRFYRSIPGALIRDEGIWIDI